MLSALLSGDWAGWLRGPNKRLREVQAQADIAASVRARIQGLATTPSGFGPTEPWLQQLPVVVPGLLLDAAGGHRTRDACAVWPSQAGALQDGPGVAAMGQQQQLLQALLQQPQQQSRLPQQQQQQQQKQQWVPGSYQQRILAALPAPGPQLLQLPTATAGCSWGMMSQQGCSSAGEAAAGQGQAAGAAAGAKCAGAAVQQSGSVEGCGGQLQSVWDAWLPVCHTGSSSKMSARQTAAARGEEGPAAGGVGVGVGSRLVGAGVSGSSAVAGAGGLGLSSDAAAELLLQSCKRHQKQQLLYLASGHESD